MIIIQQSQSQEHRHILNNIYYIRGGKKSKRNTKKRHKERGHRKNMVEMGHTCKPREKKLRGE